MLIDYLNINIVLTKDYSNFVPKTSSTRQPHGFVQTGLEIRNLPRAVQIWCRYGLSKVGDGRTVFCFNYDYSLPCVVRQVGVVPYLWIDGEVSRPHIMVIRE